MQSLLTYGLLLAFLFGVPFLLGSQVKSRAIGLGVLSVLPALSAAFGLMIWLWSLTIEDDGLAALALLLALWCGGVAVVALCCGLLAYGLARFAKRIHESRRAAAAKSEASRRFCAFCGLKLPAGRLDCPSCRDRALASVSWTMRQGSTANPSETPNAW